MGPLQAVIDRPRFPRIARVIMGSRRVSEMAPFVILSRMGIAEIMGKIKGWRVVCGGDTEKMGILFID